MGDLLKEALGEHDTAPSMDVGICEICGWEGPITDSHGLWNIGLSGIWALFS